MQAKGVACISKGRFFWSVEGRVLYIYLASGNQKNRPFGAVPLFPRNQPPAKNVSYRYSTAPSGGYAIGK